MPVEKLRQIEKDFCIPDEEMKKIIKDFHAEMIRGLAGEKSSLKMIPTYVDKPTGKEKGKFIALDLGGTNFRVLELELKGEGKNSLPKEKKFVLEKKYTIGRGNELFDFIAGCVKNFIKEQKVNTTEKRDIGFTFSFPVKQTGIASGILLNWTKDFSAHGVEGKDVVRLLNDAFKRKGLNNVNLAALTNDTVGTLVTCAYEDPHCDVGIILGTGTNACYQEKTAEIKKWIGPKSAGKHMIINIEWGNFNKLRLTGYDKLLDRNSKNPKEQILEKMVSGMYLGEIARIVLRDFSFFTFHNPYSFKSEYMSRIEADKSKDLGDVKSFLAEHGVSGPTTEERKLIKRICHLVSLRGARISAAGLAAVLTKIDPKLQRKHTIAIDGSVYEKHPGFPENIKTALKEIFSQKASRIKIVLAKDGSGIGAAIIASLA